MKLEEAAHKKEELLATFRELDSDGDGFVSASELLAAWNRDVEAITLEVPIPIPILLSAPLLMRGRWRRRRR